MSPTFILSIRLLNIKSPLKEAAIREINASSLRKLPTYFANHNFVRYVGQTTMVTNALDYLLDEMLLLPDFVAIAIYDNEHISIRGKGYRHHIFTPSLLFSGGEIAITNIPVVHECEHIS